jgi:hypothetical protein
MQSPIDLGTSENFTILSKSGVTNVPHSAIIGDVGTSPIAATALTGFALKADATNVFSTSPQVAGKIYGANYAVPTPARLTTAISDMETAYTDAAGRITPDFTNLNKGRLGGLVLAPGLYKWTTGLNIAADVTLRGNSTDVWIFQTTGNVNVASSMAIVLEGGARWENIFWQVAGFVNAGTGATTQGVFLVKTHAIFLTGATHIGRVLAQTQVVLQKNTMTSKATPLSPNTSKSPSMPPSPSNSPSVSKPSNAGRYVYMTMTSS